VKSCCVRQLTPHKKLKVLSFCAEIATVWPLVGKNKKRRRMSRRGGREGETKEEEKRRMTRRRMRRKRLRRSR